MTAIVRIYTHPGVITAPVSASSGRFSSDSLSQLKQPYMGKERLTVDTSTPASSSAVTAPNGTRIVFVQVQHAKIVQYEITPAGQTPVTANNTSPSLAGDTVFEFGPQWTISFIESSE